MKIGITGTREGMTDYQSEQVYDALNSLMQDCIGSAIKPEFHHGDCVGVDSEAALFAQALGYTIVCHPPTSSEYQGSVGGDEVRAKAGYLQRNRTIVDECDILLVVPLQMAWQPRGGTWYTHDYAKKKDVLYLVCWPEGIIC